MTAFSRKPSTISVEDVGFFEGAEKLLEIWFLLETAHYKHGEPGTKRGLRTISRCSYTFKRCLQVTTNFFTAEMNWRSCWS